MKRPTIVLAAILAMCSAARAAEVTGGIRFGLNFAKVESEGAGFGPSFDEARTGICAGITVDIGLTDAFSIQTGLMYTQKGGEGTGINIEGKPADFEVRLDYVEIPALARFHLAGGRAYVDAGISFGVNTDFLAVEVRPGSTSTTTDKDMVKDTEISLVLGGGAAFEVEKGKVSVGIQYSLGLTDCFEVTDVDSKSRALSIVVGYTF